MQFVLEPWHWFVLGIILILSELILPAFAALWFGIGAIMVGILYWMFPMMGLTTQLLTWIVLSVLCTLAWFKFIKPLSTDKTKAGLSREATIGQVGMVIQTNLDHGQVKVRFPLLSSVQMNGNVVRSVRYKLATGFVWSIFSAMTWWYNHIAIIKKRKR